MRLLPTGSKRINSVMEKAFSDKESSISDSSRECHLTKARPSAARGNAGAPPAVPRRDRSDVNVEGVAAPKDDDLSRQSEGGQDRGGGDKQQLFSIPRP